MLRNGQRKQIGWSARRELSKINYKIHTDAIKSKLIPSELTVQQTSVIYASEADVLNMALFGMTAKQWRDDNPDKKEKINAVLIEDGLSQSARLKKLNNIAIHQMTILETQTTTVLK